MHRTTHRWGICVWAAALTLTATGARGQSWGETVYRGPIPEQTPIGWAGGFPQPIPALPPRALEYQPVAYEGPVAVEANPNADLAARVADLERRLAESAKASEPARPAATSKPIIAPAGRIQFEMANFTQDATSNAQFGKIPNAVGFRRARIAVLGEFDTLSYIVEVDFANRGIDTTINSKSQGTAMKDVYVQMRYLPWLNNVRVGHFKECFGLEQITSDNYTTFMERSMCDEGAFVPGRNNGIMAFNWTENERATWAIGVFTNQTGYDQPPLFQYDHWGLDLTMRGTFVPWYDEPSGGRGVLHTGIDYAYRSAPNNLAVFASRPECAFFAPTTTNLNGIVNMKLTDVDHWQVLGTEAAVAYGPISLQSEVYAMALDRLSGVQNHFWGCYAFVSYFLTGEGRPYNRKMGAFDRIRPYENFFRVRTEDGNIATGLGAWEVAYRFSYLDMLEGIAASPTDPLTAGAGRAADHTVGVNWYLTPFTRIMFNYVHSFDTVNVPIVDAAKKTVGSHRVSGGSLDEFMTRLAIDF